MEKLLTEARSTASLSHANIVKVYDVGKLDDDHFISMEYIEGENFMTIIRRNKTFTTPQILFISTKILKALDYSHKKGIIHRDIKPQNIMINRQKEIKLLDFGIAVIRGDVRQMETSIIRGTPNYMSPEQIQGVRLDHRSDIYSVGATLFHIITGKLPFRGENVFYQHLFEKIPSIKDFRGDIPDKLIQIIEKCMEKKREDRYQTAQEMLNDIELVKDEKGVQEKTSNNKEVDKIRGTSAKPIEESDIPFFETGDRTVDPLGKSSDTIGRKADTLGRTSDTLGRSSDTIGRGSDTIGSTKKDDKNIDVEDLFGDIFDE